MKHTEYKCDRVECYPCMFCEGGLFACSVCDSFEGATTTDCPGRRMTPEETACVYTGDLDFREGSWVQLASGSCSSHFGKPGCPR